MDTLAKIINIASAVAAFVAAILWWRASKATAPSDYTGDVPEGVPYLTFHGDRGPIEITKSGKRIDVTATLRLQGKLNSYAAAAAAVAALLQGLSLLLPGKG